MGLTLILTRRAEKDLDNIRAYTLQRWGEEQLQIYGALFDKAFSMLLKKPEIGSTRRPGTPTGMKSIHVGKHILFYKVKGNKIIVSFILHERMDFLRHLS